MSWRHVLQHADGSPPTKVATLPIPLAHSTGEADGWHMGFIHSLVDIMEIALVECRAVGAGSALARWRAENALHFRQSIRLERKTVHFSRMVLLLSVCQSRSSKFRLTYLPSLRPSYSMTKAASAATTKTTPTKQMGHFRCRNGVRSASLICLPSPRQTESLKLGCLVREGWAKKSFCRFLGESGQNNINIII